MRTIVILMQFLGVQCSHIIMILQPQCTAVTQANMQGEHMFSFVRSHCAKLGAVSSFRSVTV